ncbi:MAG: sensor histidine kinase [Bryobacterales bacterium]|jgi:signal transduction histidine kinase|nr:sensor histidine kinase [Bryobacterales bacterium]
MGFRSWPFLTVAFAFGCLIAIVAASGLATSRRAALIFEETVSLRQVYSDRARMLAAVESGAYLSSIFVRDYLLDQSHLTGEFYRSRLSQLREETVQQLDGLSGTAPDTEKLQIEQLRKGVDEYWDSLEPLFEWTPAQKLGLSTAFLRNRVLPLRDGVLEMARETQELIEQNLDRQQTEVDRRHAEFRKDLTTMFSIAFAIGLLVAVASLAHFSRIQKRAEETRRRAEQAEEEMRRLSRDLVSAQEEERKSLSRELHDAVGQMLTALRIEIGILEQFRRDSSGRFEEALHSARDLSERTLQAVRNISMGLRPSMLDDLGLAPAIQWQAREFSRRTGIPVNVEIEGNLEDLPETHRTCVYRVVQEALTNCTRHAEARHIDVVLCGQRDRLHLAIRDDGVGLPSGTTRRRGLGLIGIEERVSQLGGLFAVHSKPGSGTAIEIDLPVPAGVPS